MASAWLSYQVATLLYDAGVLIGTAQALAEAELEYDDHTSQAVYARFPIEKSGVHALAEACGKPAQYFEGKAVSALAWTTTPWTLPANRALAINPMLEYSPCGMRRIACLMVPALHCLLDGASTAFF